MFSRRGWALSGSVLLSVAVAWNTGASIWYWWTGILIAGWISLVVSWWRARPKLVGQRFAPEAVQEGVDWVVRLRVRSQRDLSQVVLSDQCPATFNADLEPLFVLPTLRRGQSIECRYRVRSRRRGLYSLGPMVSTTGDRLGVFTWRRSLVEPQPVMVYPQLFDIDELPGITHGLTPWLGVEAGRQSGAFGDFFGVREYHFGDELRRIHWKTSARLGELAVTEYEQSTTAELTILIDLQESWNLGSGRECTGEYAIRIAASIVQHLTKRGVMVQLVANSLSGVHVPFGKGTRHGTDILEILACVALDGCQPLDHQLAGHVEVPPHSTCVVIMTDGACRESHLLTELGARHVHVLPVLLSAASFSGHIDRSAQASHWLTHPTIMDPIYIQRGDSLSECFRKAVHP